MLSSPHPLNEAVIAEVFHALRNGRLRWCQAIGFNAAALAALKNPAVVALLANAKVPWCSIRVHTDVLQRLLKQVQDLEQEVERIDRMLRLGASTEMLSEFFGLTHQEVALRRQMLELPQRKGRWPVMSEPQDAELWKQWHTGVKERGLALNEDASMLALGMDLAEAQSLPLSVVWSAIRGWIEQERAKSDTVPNRAPKSQVAGPTAVSRARPRAAEAATAHASR